MTASLFPLGVAVALGALTLRLALTHGSRIETQSAASRIAMNRDIERRLDLAVNGPSAAPPTIRTCPGPLPPCEPRSFVSPAQPCASPELGGERP
jgi:hypothetical protein